MNPLTRDELIELGLSVRAEPLTQWAARQLAASRGKEERLQARGLTTAHLAGIRDLVATVERSWKEGGDAQDLPPEEGRKAHLAREEASAWRREANLMAKVEFGSSPDQLARFRTGVQTGLLLVQVTKELVSVVALLRELSARLAPLGGTEGFAVKGERLIRKLEGAKEDLDAACRALPEPAARRCHDKGLLYDLTRRLVRTGQLEFMNNPEEAAAFNFAGVSQKRAPSARSRPKKEKVTDP